MERSEAGEDEVRTDDREQTQPLDECQRAAVLALAAMRLWSSMTVENVYLSALLHLGLGHIGHDMLLNVINNQLVKDISANLATI